MIDRFDFEGLLCEAYNYGVNDAKPYEFKEWMAKQLKSHFNTPAGHEASVATEDESKLLEKNEDVCSQECSASVHSAKKYYELAERLYDINRRISLNCIAMKQPIQPSQALVLNLALADIIKDLRSMQE